MPVSLSHLSPSSLAVEVIFKVFLTNASCVSFHPAWLYAGTALHELNLALKAQRGINIIMAIAMSAVVVLTMSYHSEKIH